MKILTFNNREEWRTWLAANHASEREVWLLYHKKVTGIESIPYDDAVEEALCYGWIDSIIKKLDETRYVRKFTPRKENSQWSAVNIRRVERLIQTGRISEQGLRLVEAAKQNGRWYQPGQKPKVRFPVHLEFEAALEDNPKAKRTFEGLAPTYQQQYLGWIGVAKRADTRAKRIKESLQLLEEGLKLGLK